MDKENWPKLMGIADRFVEALALYMEHKGPWANVLEAADDYRKARKA